MYGYFTRMIFDRHGRQRDALQRVGNVFYGKEYFWYMRKAYKKARWRKAETRAINREHRERKL